ncbi:MAG: hypothetical protein P4L83_21065 [Nevskia sp.]|nr:hypothetical protein [Nevskia sp.]
MSPNVPSYRSAVPLAQGCDWSPIYGDTATQNFAFPEANATYWQASPPQSGTAGMQVRIDGQFPNARYFSISLYDSGWKLIGALSDYQLQTQTGTKPTAGRTQADASTAAGQPYTAFIVFGAPPASPAANTLYVPPQSTLFGPVPASSQHLYLLYRVYMPYGSTASGDVPLPTLTVGGQPLSTLVQTAACQDTASQELQNALYAVNSPPGQAPFGAPQAPSFSVFNGAGAAVNGDNRYMSATLGLPAGYLYIVRGKAPSFTSSATVPAGSAANVRYWSICQDTSTSTEVVGCVGDRQAVLDSGGYYNVAVTVQSTAPAGADAAHGFNWMPFGPQSPGAVIYRQMLAAPGFQGAIGSGGMGSYAPQIVYCRVATFQTLAAAYPKSPDQVFKGCGGTLN